MLTLVLAGAEYSVDELIGLEARQFSSISLGSDTAARRIEAAVNLIVRKISCQFADLKVAAHVASRSIRDMNAPLLLRRSEYRRGEWNLQYAQGKRTCIGVRRGDLSPVSGGKLRYLLQCKAGANPDPVPGFLISRMKEAHEV